MSLASAEPFFSIWVFVLGSVVGSFLNVCIYRMPRNLSVSSPKRSFCPSCKQTIPWHRNIPLVSWLMLRGKCADCGASISARYFLVELLTACAFLAMWIVTPLFPDVVALWVFVSGLLVATFIDFEHFIIPDEITIGGTVAGLLCALAWPGLLHASSRLGGLLASGIGAATGFLLLAAIVVAGKWAFGKKRIRFKKPVPFRWRGNGEVAFLEIDGTEQPWEEFFPDERAVLVIDCATIRIGEKSIDQPIKVRSHYETLELEGEQHDLNAITEFSGELTSVFFERDAMGFGDVKFIAAIGAFLGWQAVLFTVFAASIFGSIIGGTALLLRKRGFSAKIPFGPYLALGALGWLLGGERLADWYVQQLGGVPW